MTTRTSAEVSAKADEYAAIMRSGVRVAMTPQQRADQLSAFFSDWSYADSAEVKRVARLRMSA